MKLHKGIVNGQVFQGLLSSLGLVTGEEFRVTVILDSTRVHNNAEMDALKSWSEDASAEPDWGGI